MLGLLKEEEEEEALGNARLFKVLFVFCARQCEKSLMPQMMSSLDAGLYWSSDVTVPCFSVPISTYQPVRFCLPSDLLGLLCLF